MIGIVRIALKRPYTFVVLAIFIFIIGPLAALRMPTDIFPAIDIPVVSVVWQYTGLSPDQMEGRIMAPFQRVLTTTVNGVEHIEGSSLNGYGVVKIFFQPGTSIATANAQVTSQASGADLASTQLSLEIELARSYIDLRGLDQQIQLIEATDDAYQKALDLTRNRHGAGIVSGLDVARASNQLSSAQSDLTQVGAKRALLEHAAAVLVGASPSEFRIEPATRPIALSAIPVGVPSALLQRRPDIAAAERRVAEANSRIGVARAAYFPTLTLSAGGGVQSSMLSELLSAPSSFWTIGPTLGAYLLDGGKRRAQVASAKAATSEAGTHYRSVVLASFRQVEDDLSLLDDLGTATAQQQDAAAAADTAVNLSLARYRRGAVSYLDVVDAQSAALKSERSVMVLRTQQLDANVDLIRALGGGWSRNDLPGGCADCEGKG
jgi:NodT family efflux transporter outer membrane factor (OMF) lipoprotein